MVDLLDRTSSEPASCSPAPRASVDLPPVLHRDVRFGAAIYGSFLAASVIGFAYESGAGARTMTASLLGSMPAVVRQLPPAIYALQVAAVAAALHPVFLIAAAVILGAFGLSRLLRGVPLRETAGSDAPDRDVPADAYTGGASRGGSRNAGRGSGMAGAPVTLRR